MFFPIGDTQVQGGYKPIVSYSFIAINVLIFLIQVSTEGNLICEFSTIPADIVKGDHYLTLLTSMFMHGSWMHLIGNMLFLWVFADNIEAKIGSVKFLVFYLLGGLAASFAHIYFSTANASFADIACYPCSMTIPCPDQMVPHSSVIPSLGASGAIAAVMGAYLYLFPKSQIKVIILILFRSFYMPAILFLGIWFVQQMFYGLGSLSVQTSASDGTAWWAHVGGFVFGLVAAIYLKHIINFDEADNPQYD
ncbi:MAG: rhomboid family intramembrane serine protease [Saprospiraceae bacterium]